MFLSDPSLYGLNLPYRDIPLQTPFVPPVFGMNFPYKEMFPYKDIPLQTPFVPYLYRDLYKDIPVQTPYMGFFPWQNAQRFVPPMFHTPFHAPFHTPFTPWNYNLPFAPFANMVRPFAC